MGARNVEPVNGGGDWVVSKPEHWIFAGTGVKRGDRIPGLIGWEYHGDPPTIPGLEIVAGGTAWVGGQTPQNWTATIYPGPKGNFVFNASTIFWAQGLSSPPGHTLPGRTGPARTGPMSESRRSPRTCSIAHSAGGSMEIRCHDVPVHELDDGDRVRALGRREPGKELQALSRGPHQAEYGLHVHIV